jgi:hypothetical protein
VYCQLDALRHCFPSSVRRTLKEIPESLDETYERIVMDIKKGIRAYAYRMLQCMAVAIRPLSVGELAELLALDFDEATEGIPRLHTDWRWHDHEQAVLSTCSSLITVVVDHDSRARVVQFSHFSVKEFLMSGRLAMASNDVSQCHIVLEDANTVLAQACIGVLLRNPADQDVADSISLTRYATKHWVAHAQAENVASRIRNGIQHLFDPSASHFSAWVQLHDVCYAPLVDDFQSMIQPEAAPLYDAAFCGLDEVVTVLALENPQNASAIGGGCGTAMHAAALQGHVHVVRSLIQCGVDANVQGLYGWTPLHFASWWGSLDVVQYLLDHGADVDAKDKLQATALCAAATRGHLDIVRLLLDRHADVNSRYRGGWTPLHGASADDLSKGDHAEVVGLLLKRGANPNARDNDGRTPLHLVPSSKPEVAQVLLVHGADVDAEDMEGKTPVLVAWAEGRSEIAQLLPEFPSK